MEQDMSDGHVNSRGDKISKIQELEAMKERLVQISNELLVMSDSHVYTALHLNEAKNILTRVQREIENG